MPPGRRLTGCATSDHPDPAAAVGEVVGHLQNSLAGSPQFALVLVDEKIGSWMSTIAATVHGLLGPDLLLAVAGPHVAGAEHLGPPRTSLAVWALCGIDVAAVDALDEKRDTAGSVATTALILDQKPDGTVVVEFGTNPDAPRPMFITGDGRRWRPSPPTISFPSGSATVIRVGGQREVGTMMVATEARGRTLVRLDHVPVRAILVDLLETTDAFVGGPSLEFPPLRAIVNRPSGLRKNLQTIDIVAVDNDDGSVELATEVEVGDRIQLIAYDRDVAARALAGRLLGSGKPGDHGVLLDGDVAVADADELGPIATAALRATPSGAVSRSPWLELSAVVVHAVDED